uniref:Peptidase A2 domain-containing protein n=1 Tax=Amphimedon queenslandica TaxID=400682 RepID=A0A1X7TL05_AMPQE
MKDVELVGGLHLAPACRFIHERSRACCRRGHIAKVCCSKDKEFKPAKQTASSSHNGTIHFGGHDEADEGSYALFTVTSKSKPITLTVKLNDCPIKMELDTGPSSSAMGETTVRSILANTLSIEPTEVTGYQYLLKPLLQ